MSRRDVTTGATSRDRGFTIVEALVAFAILAVLGTALFQALGGSMATSRNLEQRERALMLARSLYEAVGLREVARLGQAEGTDKGGLRWRREVASIPQVPGEARYELRRIRIEILAPVPDDAVLAEVETVRLFPLLEPHP